MILIEEVLISDDVLSKKFKCQLNQCKGRKEDHLFYSKAVYHILFSKTKLFTLTLFEFQAVQL